MAPHWGHDNYRNTDCSLKAWIQTLHLLLRYFIKVSKSSTKQWILGENVFAGSRRMHTVYVTSTVLPGTSSNTRNLLFTTFTETLQGEGAEHWLLTEKLTAFLPQDVALWRFQNTWTFMCCSTPEVILSWEPLTLQSCIYRANRAWSVRAVLAPSHAFMCHERVQVVLLNLWLLNLPFWKGSRRGHIPPCSSIDSSLVTPAHLRDNVLGHTALMLCAEQRGNGNAGTSILAQLLGWAKGLFLWCCFPAD